MQAEVLLLLGQRAGRGPYRAGEGRAQEAAGQLAHSEVGADPGQGPVALETTELETRSRPPSLPQAVGAGSRAEAAATEGGASLGNST